VVFAEPAFDVEAASVANLSRRFKEKFNYPGLPGGFHTADAYDAVRLLAYTIGQCGEGPERVAECLRKVTDYQGVTGKISINSSGDGVREVVLKRIGADGKPRELMSRG